MKDWMKPRTIFALMFYLAFLWLIVVNKTNPPDYLGQIVTLLLGFYFGQKTKDGAK